MSYWEVYQRRLGRYGDTTQERIKNQRILLFEKYKQQSVYQIPFKDGTAVFEPYKQNETKTIMALLTDLDVKLDNGELYDLPNVGGDVDKWMVFYEDKNHARGYNKYYMLKMTHTIHFNDEEEGCPAYYFGNMSAVIQDLLKLQDKLGIYEELDKNEHLILPAREVKKDDYISIEKSNEVFLVTGFDKSSVPGVLYVSINQTFEREKQKIDIEESSQKWV